MKFCLFLHFYQPSDQRLDILDGIVNESYRPLISNFLKNPHAFVTLNINACLTEMLAKNGFGDVAEGIRKLSERGQLELTSSAKYHPFLPILPEREIIHQIKLNDQTNRRYFGKSYHPQGFFLPEMGFSQKVGKIVSKLGFKWIIIDEIAYKGKIGAVKYDRFYTTHGLKVFFRNRRMSDLILSAMIRTPQSLKEALREEDYCLAAMDGETFGHHRPGLVEDLFKLYRTSGVQYTTLSQLKLNQTEEVNPISSTWATSEKEIEEGKNFYLYYNPQNKLHRLQKKLMDLAMKYACNERISRSLSCNHMWWSNPDSWWSIEEIEKGAFNLRRILRPPAVDNKIRYKADKLYRQILDLAFKYQRSGKVRELHSKKETYKKIPFKNRAKPGEYEAILEILKNLETEAVKRGEYEMAIRWRDSRHKIDKGLDLYDFVHIVDQMRQEGRLGDYEALAKKYREAHHK